MRVLKLLGVGAVVAVATFIAIGLVLPNRWQVERSAQVKAPAGVVQQRIASLKSWPDWSATSTTADPSATFTWEGVDGQIGSAMRWQGPKLGSGMLTLTQTLDGERVSFEGAIESERVNASSIFTLHEDAGVTTVKWTDEGATPPIVGGYMRGLIESALGAQMEASLAALARLTEDDARSAAAPAPGWAPEPAPAPAVAAGEAP